MLDCWKWDATKRPGFKELGELLKKGKEQTEAECSQSLLSRIDELNEVNSESYNRIVERRDSEDYFAEMTETPTLTNSCTSSRPTASSNSDVSDKAIVKINGNTEGHVVNISNGKDDGIVQTFTY